MKKHGDRGINGGRENRNPAVDPSDPFCGGYEDETAGQVAGFDTSSGISEAEQRDILKEIDEIGGRNRLSPSPDDLTVHAKKKGILFPALVNIFALLVLAGGLFLLLTFYEQDMRLFREGSLYPGLANRQLIQQIRKETAEQLRIKDREIAAILAKLEEINQQFQKARGALNQTLEEKEAELRRRITSEIAEERGRLIGENTLEQMLEERMRLFEEQKTLWLNAEREGFRTRLEAELEDSEAERGKLREEYLNALALLQTERAQIVEAARIQEENAHIAAAQKAAEQNALYEQSRQDLGAAREEIFRLASEQERSSLLEGELSGFYVSVNNQIRDGHLNEATNTLRAMREFLNTPGFQQLRPIQSRKELYLASIDVLSEVIAGKLWGNAPTGETPSPVYPVPDPREADEALREYGEIIAELKARNSVLEQEVADRDQIILAFDQRPPDTGTETPPVPPNYEETLNALRTQNASLQQTASSLRSQNTNLQQTITNLRSQNTSQQQTITTLRAQNTNLQQTGAARDSSVNTLRTQNANLQQIVNAHENTIREFRDQNEGLQRSLAELRGQTSNFQQTVGARDTAITELRAQNATLQQAVTDLRSQNTALQQTVSTRDGSVTELRAQNATLQQTVTELRSQTVNQQQMLTDLRAQTSNFQQTMSAKDSAISDLRSQTSNLQQTIAARDSAITELRAQTVTLQQTVSDLRSQNTVLTQTVDQLRQTNEAVRKLLGSQ